MDLGSWLRGLGLQRYEAAFWENEIDDTVRPGSTGKDLKALGITIVEHRRKRLDAIAALRVDAKAPPTILRRWAGPRDSAERRQVSIMFSDVVGSTAMAASMDPEDFKRAGRLRSRELCP